MINEIEFDILNNLYNSSKGRAQNKNATLFLAFHFSQFHKKAHFKVF